MKKTVICLLLVAVGLAAASCFFEPEIAAPETLNWNSVAGTSWASQPYDNNAINERVTFFGNGRVSVTVGDLEGGTATSYGDWMLSNDLKHIEIRGLRIFDRMSGRRYEIIEGYVAAGSEGRGLRLAYEAGSGPEYGPLFNYAEVTELVTVVPWEPVKTTIL